MAVVRSPAVAPELESGAVTIKDFCSEIAARMGPFHRLKSAGYSFSFDCVDAVASEDL